MTLRDTCAQPASVIRLSDMKSPRATCGRAGNRGTTSGKSPSQKRFLKQHGFTLIELMIVVVIIGVLTAIAYPSYQAQVRKTHRSEAKAALADAASRMEKYFMDNKTYNTTSMTALGYGSSPLTTTNGYYQVSIVAASTSATAYQIQAVAQATGNQNQDTGCTTMTLNSLGQKLPAACW